jgi:hypothetical protein
MSKKLKASYIKTNIAKPVKIELFRIMRDYQTESNREQAVARSMELQELSKIFGQVPLSPDTFRRLKTEIKEMPLSEVSSLPKDLQVWMVEIRPDLKQELEKQGLQQIEKLVNWIDDHRLKHNELPLIPDFMAPMVEDYLPGARVSKGMKLKKAPPSAQFWCQELLPSQRDKVLQLVEWLGQNREDYQEMIKRHIPGSPSPIRIVPKRKAS